MNTKNANSHGSSNGGKPGMSRFFDTPAPGQFHSMSVETEDWESFVLVLEIRTDGMYPECLVVPGSMDVLKGGPDDLLFKHPDYGDCWFLDLSQARTVRADALLPGFAALPEPELVRIRQELAFYQQKKESGMYLYGPPFIGETDSRRDYHASLGTLMEIADKEAANRYWRRLASSFRIEPRRDDASVGVRDNGKGADGRRSRFFDILSKREERESSSERKKSAAAGERARPEDRRGLKPQSGLEMGLMFSISDMAFLSNDKTKRHGQENIELSFTPEADERPGGESDFISVEIRFEEEKILSEVISEANPGAFDGIQLRRCSDRLVIGTIRNGRMEAELIPELEKGIYFAWPGDVPLKGKWEER